MEIPATKLCSKCAEDKPLTTEFFNTQLRGMYGFKAYCKSCQSKQYKIWHEANKERLQAYVERRREAEGSFTPGQFQKVIALQKGLCFYCGEPGGLITEHVVPLSKGGTNWIANIVAACVPCNGRKGARLLEEFRPDLVASFKTLNLLKANNL